MKRRRKGDARDDVESSDQERLLSLLQHEKDPVNAINSIRSILNSHRQHHLDSDRQKEDISSLLLNSKILIILECDFYWLLDQSGVLDFRDFLLYLSNANQTLKLSSYLRRVLLNEDSHSTIASDICLFLFHLISKEERNDLRLVCECVLEEMLGIHDGRCSSPSSPKYEIIPLISLQDLRVFVDLCLILLVTSKTSTSHVWMTDKLRYFLLGILDSSYLTADTGLNPSTSLSIVEISNNVRRIIGPHTIFDCVRDMIHSPETSMFDPDVRLKYTKESSLHDSCFLLVLLDSTEYVEQIQDLATSALRIALHERKHNIVIRAVGFAEWALHTHDFEKWLENNINIQQSSSSNTGQVTNSHANGKIELNNSDVASFFFFAMCELVQQFSKVSTRVLSKAIRSRRQINKEAADVFLAGARTRQRELDALYNPLPSRSSSSTIDCLYGIRPERITNWASSLCQFNKLPSSLEQLCNNVQPLEVLRAMQSLDLSDTNLRSNCVVIAKAMFEGGMCSINQFEEFQFALQGTPTSNMSTSLHHLNVTDETASNAIHECFHIVRSLTHRIMHANEMNPQLAHDTSCQWKHLCHQAGIGLSTDDTTSTLILSTLLFQFGNAIDSKITTTLGNTMNYESYENVRENSYQLLLWVSLYDCFFTTLLSVNKDGYNCMICSIVDAIGESSTTADELYKGASFSTLFLPIDSIWKFSRAILVEFSDASRIRKFYAVLNSTLENLSTLRLVFEKFNSLGNPGSDSTFSFRPDWSERYVSIVGPMYIIALLLGCGLSSSISDRANSLRIRYFYEAEKCEYSDTVATRGTGDVLAVLKHDWWQNVLRLLEHCDYSNVDNFAHCITDIYTCISMFISSEDKQSDTDVWSNMLVLSSIDFSVKSTSNSEQTKLEVHKRAICSHFMVGVMKGVFMHLNRSDSFFTKAVPKWIIQGLLDVMTPGASISHMKSLGVLISVLLQLLFDGNQHEQRERRPNKWMRWVALFTYLQDTLSYQGLFELSSFSEHVQMILLDSSLFISCRVIELMRFENCNRVYVNYVHKNKEDLCECFLYGVVNNVDVLNQSIAKTIGKVPLYNDEQAEIGRNTIGTMGWTFGRISLMKDSPDYNFQAIDDLESYVALLKVGVKDKDLYIYFLTCAICGCLLTKLFNGEHVVSISSGQSEEEHTNPKRVMQFIKRCCWEMKMKSTDIEVLIAEEMVRNVPVMVVVCCLKHFREMSVNLALGLGDDENSQGLADYDDVINCGPFNNDSITMQNCIQVISPDCVQELGLIEEIEIFTDMLAASVFRQAELNFME